MDPRLYVPHLDTRLYVDHGPAGITSTLAQNHVEKGSDKWKAIHHMSRSLVKSEMNYNKLEGESLAIYSGVLMNRKYVLGTPFTVMSDHSALPALYNNTGRPAPHRVDRHRGRLGAFQLKVQFVPGEKNPCDYGSRHQDQLPDNLTKEQREEIVIEMEEEDAGVWLGKLLEETMPAITVNQMRDDMANNPELGPIVKEKQAGTKSKAMSKGPYRNMWDEIRERDRILTKGKQMVVPKSLQARAIAIAHEGHQQTDATLRLLRDSQWFRGMRAHVKAYVESCKCATAIPRNAKPPLKIKPLPKEPWTITAVDYKGPTGPTKWYLHTQMDLYSRYPEVHLTKSTGMKELRKVLDRTMRTHGRPREIWSEGGAPYNGHEWTIWVES